MSHTVNDLPLSVSSKIRLFADDCLLYRTITSQQDHNTLQNDLSELEKWANKWAMRFNAKKCYIMSINCKSTHYYTLCDHILKQVEENPYLGLTECRKTAYVSLVRSILDYGQIVWDPHLKQDVERLERVQRQAARFITGDYRTHEEGCVTSLLQSLELSSLENRLLQTDSSSCTRWSRG